MVAVGPPGRFPPGGGPTSPPTETVASWFVPLNEPRRDRPPLPTGAYQFAAYVPNPITVTPFAWFAPLSEPVRTLPGLKPAQQQFEARPSQLRPTPTTFGTLSTSDMTDTFLAGLQYWNTVTSGEIGIIVNTFSGAEIGVTGPTITTVGVSVRIVSS